MRHSVPSAPPEMVNASSVQGSSSIIVSWGEVSCQHHNGEIVGYAVKYSSGQRQTEAVVDGQAITLDDLEPLTEYSIMVAALNRNGTGQFSEPVTIVTQGTYVCMLSSLLNLLFQQQLLLVLLLLCHQVYHHNHKGSLFVPTP